MPLESGVDGGEHDARGDVAADLDAGEVPRREEGHLEPRAHPVGQPAAQRRHPHRHVEDEEPHGEEPERRRQHGGHEADHPDRHVLRVRGDVTGGDARALDELLDGVLRAGDLVEPREDGVGHLRDGGDELGQLVDEEAAEGPEEADEAQDEADHDGGRREGPRHPPGEAGDGRLHGEREEPAEDEVVDHRRAPREDEGARGHDEQHPHDDPGALPVGAPRGGRHVTGRAGDHRGRVHGHTVGVRGPSLRDPPRTAKGPGGQG